MNLKSNSISIITAVSRHSGMRRDKPRPGGRSWELSRLLATSGKSTVSYDQTPKQTRQTEMDILDTEGSQFREKVCPAKTWFWEEPEPNAALSQPLCQV